MERMLVSMFLMMPLVIALRIQQQVFLKPEIMCFLILTINTVSCALEFGLCIFMGAHSIGFDVRETCALFHSILKVSPAIHSASQPKLCSVDGKSRSFSLMRGLVKSRSLCQEGFRGDW